MLTCKKATRLISESQDRPLTLIQRTRLKFHLAMCKGCKNYNKQIEMISKACRNLGR